LLRLLAGDLRASEGAVLVDGEDILRWGPGELALRRAVLPQQTLLQFAFTARQVVALGRSPHLRGGREGAGDAAVVEGAMRRTETLHLAKRTYPGLSGGEQARVSLARVLAQEAPILLLDEPTAALDLRHQHQVMRTAASLAAGGAAILAILHDLNLAARYASRVLVLGGGEARGLGAPGEVLCDGLLSDVFGVPIRVLTSPLGNWPLVLVDADEETCGEADWRRRGHEGRAPTKGAPDTCTRGPREAMEAS